MKESYSLNEIKLAVINENVEKLQQISNKEPCFSSIDEAKEILNYINLAKEIIKKEKLRLFKNMQEIKKLKKFNQKDIKSGIDFKI